VSYTLLLKFGQSENVMHADTYISFT